MHIPLYVQSGIASSAHAVLPARNADDPRKSNLRMRALSYCFWSSGVREGRRDVGGSSRAGIRWKKWIRIFGHGTVQIFKWGLEEIDCFKIKKKHNFSIQIAFLIFKSDF